MRGNNRKSIEKCRKRLSQFTTMNVIDGQAGLVIYSSLIFYSLTIDNILNIIVLLILAGVSIGMLTGENGILTKATKAKELTEEAEKKEQEDINNLIALIDNETGTVSKVTDSKPGELEQDSKNINLYYINSIEDLVAFSNEVNNGNTFEGKTVKLNCSLDFNSDNSYVDVSNKTALINGEGFIPIGNDITEIKDENNHTQGIDGKYFSGTFDGNKYIIYNLYQNIENYSVGGLFGATSNATIKNVILQNGSVTNSWNQEKMSYVGGLIGYQYSGTTTDCIININVLGRNPQDAHFWVGGVIGDVAPIYEETDIKKGGNVINCINRGTVRAETENSSENVTDKRVMIGGVIGGGYKNSTLEGLKNEGKVYYKNTVPVTRICIAGIVGYISETKKINNIINEGKVFQEGEASGIYIGGVNGLAHFPTATAIVTNISNIGNIDSKIGNLKTTTLYLGGTFGFFDGEINLYNAYNIGNIILTGNTIAGQYVGGVVGKLSGIINNTYNLGKINVTQGQIAGIVYSINSSGSIFNAYYSSEIASIGTTTTNITDESIAKTSGEIKSQDFVNILNNNIKTIDDINDLLTWKLGENGYPTFI